MGYRIKSKWGGFVHVVYPCGHDAYGQRCDVPQECVSCRRAAHEQCTGCGAALDGGRCPNGWYERGVPPRGKHVHTEQP